MVDFAGWEMPIQYSSIVEEHTAVRQQAGLFDISHMGRLLFTGPAAEAFLNHLLTNDVLKLTDGQVRYSLVCNESGGILDDVLIYKFPAGRFALVVNASNREKILDWIEQQRSGFDFDVTDETFDTFMIALQGPESVAILSSLVEIDPSQMAYYSTIETEVCGVKALLSRTGYTGEDGFEISAPSADGPQVWDQLIKAGEARGLIPCGLGCRDTLRLEAAMPLYGHEMDESVDPFTAGLSFGVRLKKNDYLGRDALVEKKQKQDLPIRVGIELTGRRIAREGAELFDGSSKIGHITSGTFSPTLQKAIAMGYISGPLSAVGSEIEVDIRGRRERATVVPLPFYKRS